MELAYLESIKGKNGKYRRVISTPLRYAGGKSNAIGLLLSYLPNIPSKKVISIFFGGGSFELTLSKLNYTIIGYDIFSLLVNFWNVLINNRDELIAELEQLVPDKESFTRNRHILLHYWDSIKPSTLKYNTKNKLELTDYEKEMLNDNCIRQAAYYYYNMQLSYGPMFLGWQSSVYLKPEKYDKILKTIELFESKNLTIFNESFETSIPKHQGEFLYLDPPYFLDGDSKMFKGIYPNSNFAIHHNNFNHTLLRDLLKDHRGGFLLTYNDCSVIKELYSEYRQVFPTWQYTYGQGETRRNDNIKMSHEMFVISEI
jgi:DNA adenine methylase